MSRSSLLQPCSAGDGGNGAEHSVLAWGEHKQDVAAAAEFLPPGFQEGMAAATAATGDLQCGMEELASQKADLCRLGKKKGGLSGVLSHRTSPDPKDLVKKSTQLLLARQSFPAKKDSPCSPFFRRAGAPLSSSGGRPVLPLYTERGKGPCESHGGKTTSSGVSSCLGHSSSSELVACAPYLIQLASRQLLACFASALGGLAGEEGDLQLARTAVSGLDLSARLCMRLGLRPQRNAFVVTLSCLTYLQSAGRRRIRETNIAAVRALLSLGLECGDLLEDAWIPVLQIVSQLDFLHVVAHDVLQKAREVQQQRVSSRAAGGGGGLGTAPAPPGNLSTTSPHAGASPPSDSPETSSSSSVHATARAVPSSVSVTRMSYAQGVDRGDCYLPSPEGIAPSTVAPLPLIPPPAAGSEPLKRSADVVPTGLSSSRNAKEAAAFPGDFTSSASDKRSKAHSENVSEEKLRAAAKSDHEDTVHHQGRRSVRSEVVLSLSPPSCSLPSRANSSVPCASDERCVGQDSLGTVVPGEEQQHRGRDQFGVSPRPTACETSPACSASTSSPLYTPNSDPCFSGCSLAMFPALQSEQSTVSSARPGVVFGGFLGLGTSRGTLHPAWVRAQGDTGGEDQRHVSQDSGVGTAPLGLWLAPSTQGGEATWISLSSVSTDSPTDVTPILVENALVVAREIDSSLLDLLFNQSRLLSAGAIIYFVSCLCRVSREELAAAVSRRVPVAAAASDSLPATGGARGSAGGSYALEDDSSGSTRLGALANRVFKGGMRVAEATVGKGEKEGRQGAPKKNADMTATASPRIFSLQKLVEVAHFNMDRIRFVWSRVWSILRRHFADACLHPCLPVRLYAIDSLRQLTTKFLEKDELAQFTFQSDFLKPFLVSYSDRSHWWPVQPGAPFASSLARHKQRRLLPPRWFSRCARVGGKTVIRKETLPRND